MAISKVLRCSRAYPLGCVTEWQEVTTFAGAKVLIFLKMTTEIWDALVFLYDNKYFCRYQFPRWSWNDEEIVEYLKKNL